ILNWSYQEFKGFLESLIKRGEENQRWGETIELLTWMMDWRYNTGNLRRSSLLSLIDIAFDETISLIQTHPTQDFVSI
ncbi:MAG: hypothetical protein GWN62_21650, partial [Aliifodinibius sp.]|nr:hypothetical protein [Fodinibius sp.]